MRLAVFVLGLFVYSGVGASAVNDSDQMRAKTERYETDFKAYFDRIGSSNDATEQSIAMLYRVKDSDPTALAEAGRRWAFSNPDEQSVKLLAALTCQFDHGTARRALCDDHQLLRRWQRIEPKNAFAWAISARRAEQAGDRRKFAHVTDRILASDRFDSGLTTTLDAMRASTAEDPTLSRWPIGERAVGLIGVALAIATPAPGNLIDLCPTREPIRLDRAALCRHLASLMINNGGGSLAAMLGGSLAKAYAIDDSERAQIAETLANRRALANRLNNDPRLAINPGSNSYPDAIDDFLQLWIAEGETKAIVSWLAQSPETPESAAQEARQQ